MHYSPVRHCPVPEGTFSFDLHVLGMPPAFNLSQDQTLQLRRTQIRRSVIVRYAESALSVENHKIFSGVAFCQVYVEHATRRTTTQALYLITELSKILPRTMRGGGQV